MGMLISHNLIFNFSHITQASVSESVINGHYYMSINQEDEPPTLSFHHSDLLPTNASPAQLHGRVWALENHPYLQLCLSCPSVVL